MRITRPEGLLLAAAVGGLMIGTMTATTAPPPVTFESPSGNIRCTLGPTSGKANARCVTLSPRRAAQVVAGQRSRALRFGAVGPLTAAEPLAYGRTIRGYGFRCASRESGITCIDGRTGNGFIIAREGVTLLPRRAPAAAPAPGRGCNPNYAGVCLPLNRDVDCGEITARDFRVVGTDVYRLDRDGDRIACETTET